MSFYGRSAAPEKARKMYEELKNCWCAETCAARMRGDWSKENATLGQCSITSFLVQDELGGEVLGVPLRDGGVHCFNRVDGAVFDLTSEQFGGRTLDYTDCFPQTRERHFAEDPDKLRRYELLKKLYEENKNR